MVWFMQMIFYNVYIPLQMMQRKIQDETKKVQNIEHFKALAVFSLGFLEGQGEGDSDCKKPGSFNRKSNKDF